MPELTLEERVAVLESKAAPSKWSARLLLIPLIALISLLTINVRTLKQQFETEKSNSLESAFWKLCHSEVSPETRADCFLQLVASGNVEWRSALLDDMQISGLDLANQDIQLAHFRRGKFPDARFRAADLRSTTFDLCELPGSDFSNTDLSTAILFKGNLAKADFRDAILRTTSFEQSKVQNAVFVRADMTDGFLPMADLTGADFTAAKLTNANLEAAILAGTNLALADLSGAKIEDVDFTNSNWWRARGLSNRALTDLAERYAPTDAAPESRRRDFELWQKSR